MDKQLIVNADDFGMSKGQNYGIVECFRHGVVTSTTAMVNSPWIQHAAELSQENPGLGVGLHFVLTAGRPLTPLKCLVDEKGHLGKDLWDREKQGLLDTVEIRAELNAQYDRFVDIFGHQPTHIDSHHFVHMLPAIYPVVEYFAHQKSLPLRVDRQDIQKYGLFPDAPRSTDAFSPYFFGPEISEELFLKQLDEATERGDRSLEVMCHPAFIDPVLLNSSYCLPRAKEVEVLTSPTLRKAIEQRGYRLTHFASL